MPAEPAHHPLAGPVATPCRPITRRRPTPVAATAPDADHGPVAAPSGPTATIPEPAIARPTRDWSDEHGSVATEYGLLAVVAATIVSVLLEWATSGGITSLLSSVLARVSELVGL